MFLKKNVMNLFMGKFKGKVTRRIRDAAVVKVVKAIEDGIKSGGHVDIEGCVDFVEGNRDKVSNAYFEAVKPSRVSISRDDTARGYELVRRTFERKQARVDGAYSTGLEISGRNHLRD